MSAYVLVNKSPELSSKQPASAISYLAFDTALVINLIISTSMSWRYLCKNKPKSEIEVLRISGPNKSTICCCWVQEIMVLDHYGITSVENIQVLNMQSNTVCVSMCQFGLFSPSFRAWQLSGEQIQSLLTSFILAVWLLQKNSTHLQANRSLCGREHAADRLTNLVVTELPVQNWSTLYTFWLRCFVPA